MPNYNDLKAELTLGEYIGLSHAAAAAHFNAKTVTRTRPLIPLAVLRSWSAESGARRSIEAGIGHSDSVVASICLSIRDLLTGGGDALDLSSAAVLQRIDALVAGNVFNPALRASLLALQDTIVPYYKIV